MKKAGFKAGKVSKLAGFKKGGKKAGFVAKGGLKKLKAKKLGYDKAFALGSKSTFGKMVS